MKTVVAGFCSWKNCLWPVTGITNDSRDPCTDTFCTATLPMLKHFGVPIEGLELKAATWVDEGMVKRIRGHLLLNVYIFTDHYIGLESGKSPGYGISLVAETTTGCILSSECVAMHSGASELQLPEDLGTQAAMTLLQEIKLGGVVDSTHQGLLFPTIKEFLGVQFSIKPDPNQLHGTFSRSHRSFPTAVRPLSLMCTVIRAVASNSSQPSTTIICLSSLSSADAPTEDKKWNTFWTPSSSEIVILVLHVPNDVAIIKQAFGPTQQQVLGDVEMGGESNEPGSEHLTQLSASGVQADFKQPLQPLHFQSPFGILADPDAQTQTSSQVPRGILGDISMATHVRAWPEKAPPVLDFVRPSDIVPLSQFAVDASAYTSSMVAGAITSVDQTPNTTNIIFIADDPEAEKTYKVHVLGDMDHVYHELKSSWFAGDMPSCIFYNL
ncbi:hypothetical protein SELMODRAFT_419363 [Selaginella moellendorffii]|uniref:RNA 3'-terminal phosphate cyclase insert domain-containing protein n=1 Tax=Selaginella moellendorffii TaxID=88036 RepID=D8S8P4_SELML|nr:hypothetical protein SELMODRAFT_419363 [Selaginella moellendorffii]